MPLIDELVPDLSSGNCGTQEMFPLDLLVVTYFRHKGDEDVPMNFIYCVSLGNHIPSVSILLREALASYLSKHVKFVSKFI